MDVVALFQYGVTTAVATLGTATTPDHAELLFRNAADVYFCFDGDRAGRGAAWKALESVLPRMRDGRQAFFLFLPEGEDPDTIVRSEGADGFDARLKNATPLSEFFYAEQSKEINLVTLDGRARLAERARPMLEKIPDGAFRDLMLQRLTELTGVGALRAVTQPQRPDSLLSRTAAKPHKRSLVRTAIALLLQRPSLAAEIDPHYLFADLQQPGIPLLVEMLNLTRQRTNLSTGALLEHFADRDEAAALHKLAVQDLLTEPERWTAEFVLALKQLDLETLRQRDAELQSTIRESGLQSLSETQLDQMRQMQPMIRALEAELVAAQRIALN